MRRIGLVIFGATCLAGSASGALYSYTFASGFSNGGLIPDGVPEGWSDTRVLSGVPDAQITALTVSFTVSGGYNGDLYAYLSHGTTGFAVLLNRVGRTASDPFGYGDAGFSVTLADGAANGDIHVYGGNQGNPLTGIWQVDGRAVNPTSVLNTDPRTALLNSFNGLDPNGAWTLFFADLSGGAKSTVTEWDMDITAVPEPTNVALASFGAMVAAWRFARWYTRNRKDAKAQSGKLGR